MPTYTIFSDASDGVITSGAEGVGLWLTVRTGNNLTPVTTETIAVVNVFYQLHKSVTYYQTIAAFLGFDTSVITDTDTIDTATLSLYGYARQGSTQDILEVYAKDWGATVTSADWVAGENIGAQTLLASFTATAAPGNWSVAGYNALTESGSNLRSAINKTGFTRMMAVVDKLRSVTPPIEYSGIGFYLAEQSGTTNDPKLVVTTTASGNSNFLAFF